MTAMDILEALGQTREELLCGCDPVIGGSENREADVSAIDREDSADAQDLPDQQKRKNRKMRIPLHKAKYRRAAAGLIAAAAVLLLVYVGGGVFISRSFDSGSSGHSQSNSTAESAEITADTVADTAAEEALMEESEQAEMEETTEESSAVTTAPEEPTSADEYVTETEEAETETGARTESATLEKLKLGEVYIPVFATSSLSDEEYAKCMALVALVQEEIENALSQEAYETLPVYRFAWMEESASDQYQAIGDAGVAQSEQSDDAGLDLFETDSDLLEKLGDYPVITAEEAEELLKQGYYLSWADFSEDDMDIVETASVKIQYLISAEAQIYMPYYQFTVVMDGDMIIDCYVPTVSGEYLEGTLSGGAAE